MHCNLRRPVPAPASRSRRLNYSMILQLVGGGGFVLPFCQRWGTELYKIWGKHRPIIGASRICFRCQIHCSISKCGRLKGYWARKSRLNLGFVAPIKSEEGWTKFLSQYFQFSLRPNLWYILLTVVHIAVWEVRDPFKKHIVESRRPSSYVGRHNSVKNIWKTWRYFLNAFVSVE